MPSFCAHVDDNTQTRRRAFVRRRALGTRRLARMGFRQRAHALGENSPSHRRRCTRASGDLRIRRGRGAARQSRLGSRHGSQLFQRRLRHRRLVQLLPVRAPSSVVGKEAGLDDESAAARDAHSLARRGWNISQTPLYGIGQAWAGSYDKRFYQPGLTREEMHEQAKAFCAFGATYIGWYAWDDSERQRQDPDAE